MKEIEIIDNFISIEELSYMQEYVSSNRFPWQVTKNVVDIKDSHVSCDEKYNWQMFNTLYNHKSLSGANPNIAIFDGVLNKLKIEILLRLKINLNPVTDKIIEHGMHIDVSDNLSKIATTCIFYINTNDGYTKFEDGTIVQSVENRLVKFPSYMLHSGTSCTNKSYRTVLNVNYVDANRSIE